MRGWEVGWLSVVSNQWLVQSIGQPTTDNRQPTTDNRRPATDMVWLECEKFEGKPLVCFGVVFVDFSLVDGVVFGSA